MFQVPFFLDAAGLTAVEQFGDWIERYLGARASSRLAPKAASALARLLIEPGRRSSYRSKSLTDSDNSRL